MAGEIKRDELRRERKKRFDEREKELEEIDSLRKKASRNREAAEKAYQDNQSEISTLKKQNETVGNQIEDLKEHMRQTSGFDDEERARQTTQRVNQLNERDMARLKEIENEKSSKNEELKSAKQFLDRKKTSAYNPQNVRSDTHAVNRDLDKAQGETGYDTRRQGATTDRAAAISAGENYETQIALPERKTARELTERNAGLGYETPRQGATTGRAAASAGGSYETQIALPVKKTARELTGPIAELGYDTRRQGATTGRAAASAGGSYETQIALPVKKTPREQILEEMKKKTDEQIWEASSKTSKLFDDLNKAKDEEERLKKREEDKKLELENMIDCDQSKHAKIQVYIQQNLINRDINLLLNYLVLRKSVTVNKREDLRDFFDIWQYLSRLDVRHGGIEVGDLRNIRKYLLEALEDSKSLVKEIKKKEDALLGEYKKGRTPTLKAEDDTQSKQIDSFSQMIYAKIKQKKYKDDGGPFKYLSDVLVVVRLYLAQLNTRDKSEVTDALHDYVKTRLEQSDILTLVDGHLREHKKGTGKIADLQADVRERDKKIGELEREIKKKDDAHKTEESSWWDKFDFTSNKAKKEKEEYEKKINDYEKQKEDSAKDWEEARQKLVKETDELRAQKESTDKHMEKMMEKLMGERQLGDTRFEKREEERNALCMKTMQPYIEQMREMRLKHADEEQARREEHTNNMAALQKSFEDARATWERHRSEERDGAAQRMDEFYEKIKELEREFGTSLVEWENERMELKKGLFMAEMQNMMAEYKISRLEKAV